MTPKADETYYLKEVPTSYLAQPKVVTVKDDFGNGEITSLHFLSVTDTNIYRAGGVKVDNSDKRGAFAKTFTMTQNPDFSNGEAKTAQDLFNLPGYLTVVQDTNFATGNRTLQGYWTTYDSITVYGIANNIRNATIG